MNAQIDHHAGMDLAFLDDWLERRLDEKLREREQARVPSMAIIASKGTLDMAYPPFILASTAAALGWHTEIFFTFYGLNLLKKELNLEISPLGNPAMPMKLPVGPEWLRKQDFKIPNLMMAGIPGFEKMATAMMEKTLSQKGVASIAELRALCLEAEVGFAACQMTVDLFGWSQEDFIPEVSEWLGAVSFLPRAQKADVCLYI